MLNASTIVKSPQSCESGQPVSAPSWLARELGSAPSFGEGALMDKIRRGVPMSTCKQESTIASALAKSGMHEELRRHLEGCAVCREVHSIARNMQHLADELAEEPRPSAASIWWRVDKRMRRDHARRAQ